MYIYTKENLKKTLLQNAKIFKRKNNSVNNAKFYVINTLKSLFCHTRKKKSFFVVFITINPIWIVWYHFT